MASRYRYAARPQEDTPSEYSDDYYSSGYTSEGSSAEDYPDAEPNDRRLRQAIRYLEAEGGSDSDELYEERLHQIDSEVIAKFVDEGYAFDENLYARLEELMDDQLNAIEEAEEVAREEEEYERELEEIEEERSPHALHRALDPSDSLPLAGSSRLRHSKGRGKEKTIASPPTNSSHSAGKGKGRAAAQPTRKPSTPRAAPEPDIQPLQTPISLPSAAAPRVATGAVPAAGAGARTSSKNDVIREIQWRYGGPHNDPEHYHANAPDSLPFGETLAVEEYESLQIAHDLALGPLHKGPVETNVDFSLVDERMGRKVSPYDSGSRFKLVDDGQERAVRAVRTVLGTEPGAAGEEPEWEDLGLEEVEEETVPLETAIAEFNGADRAHQVEKDYAPRVFLEQVVAPTKNAPRRKFTKRAKETAQRKPGSSSTSGTRPKPKPTTEPASSTAGASTRGTATSKPAAVAGTKRKADAPPATASAVRPGTGAEARPAKRVAFTRSAQGEAQEAEEQPQTRAARRTGTAGPHAMAAVREMDARRAAERTGTMDPEARAAIRGVSGRRTATTTTATRGSTRSGLRFNR